MVRLVFHQPLRQTEGLLRSLLDLMGIDLPVPDHTTISRRAARLTPALRTALPGGPVTLVIDSTGLKVYGAGEWHRDKHGVRGRRTWRKLHLAVDAATNTIVAATLTTSGEGDAGQVGPLLDQITGPIDTVMADGAYDGEPTYRTVAERIRRHGHHPAAETACRDQPPTRPSAIGISSPLPTRAAWAGSGKPATASGPRRKPRCRDTNASSATTSMLASCPVSRPKPPSVSPSSTA